MYYSLLFLWSFLASSILPIPSEPYYIYIISLNASLLIPLIIATLGNTLGGTTTFLLGRKGGEITMQKISTKNQKRYKQAINYVQQYGSIAMLISWVPLLGDIIVGIGGALQLSIKPSIFWMTIGKFLRYLLLGLAVLNLT